MPSLTNLHNQTELTNIKPGEYISCDYTVTSANWLGVFSNIGNAKEKEISKPLSGTNDKGSFNFICIGTDNVGRNYLIADRVIQYAIPVTAFNTSSNDYNILIDLKYNCLLKLPSRDTFKRAIIDGIAELNISKTNFDATIPCWTYEIWNNTGDLCQFWVCSDKGINDYKQNSTCDTTVGFRPVLIIKNGVSHPDISPKIKIITDPLKLVPGTAISCEYYPNTGNYYDCGTFKNFGKATLEPLSPVHIDPSKSTPKPGKFYFICVGYDHAGYPLLVSDRNVASSISYNTLASKGYCYSEGADTTIDGHRVSLRIPKTYPSLFIDIKNKIYGEWDAIFTLYNKNGIVADDVWNLKDSCVITMNQLITYNDNGSKIVCRGNEKAESISLTRKHEQSYCNAGDQKEELGFRPIMVYKDIPLDSAKRGRVGTTLPIYKMGQTVPIKPGQVISCEYTAKSGQLGKFANLGNAKKDFILADGEENPDGSFYFICVGYTNTGLAKMIADRNIQTNITINQLCSTMPLCLSSGSKITIDNTDFYIRLPFSTVDSFITKSNYGEWDAIISMMTNQYIKIPSDENIWNCKYSASYTLSIAAYIDYEDKIENDGSMIIMKGFQDKSFTFNDLRCRKQLKAKLDIANKSVGFRPVLTFAPPNQPSKTHPYRIYVSKNNDCYGIPDIWR